jgi:osmotically-inducible protein OsmY
LAPSWIDVLPTFKQARAGRPDPLFIQERNMNATLTKYARPLVIACAVIGTVSITACSSTPTKTSVGEKVDDSVITSKIKAKFVEDKDVRARAISVETFKGVVQLSGFANSQLEIDRAGEIARGVNGVVSVKNDIRMKQG